MMLFDRKEVELPILSEMKKRFEFLILEYHFKIIEEVIGSPVVVIYRNEHVQVECAGSTSYFHSEIRKIINGRPAEYSDRKYSIGFEDLAILESKGEYDHFEYFVNSDGLEVVLGRVSELFKRNQYIFTTDSWVNVAELRKLKDDEFERNFGSAQRTGKGFLEIFRERAQPVLESKGFERGIDNSHFAPYDERHLTQHVIYLRGEEEIQVSQIDWRDDYFIWYLEHNRKKLAEVNLSEIRDIEAAVDILIDQIRGLP